MNLKGFCIYHRADFDKGLTEEQRQKLLNHHVERLIVSKSFYNFTDSLSFWRFDLYNRLYLDPNVIAVVYPSKFFIMQSMS